LKRFIYFLLCLVLVFSLPGCGLLEQFPPAGMLPLPEVIGGEGQGVPTGPSVDRTAQPPAATDTPGAELEFVTTVTPVQSLTLWVPPEFDPAGDSAAGAVLRERLREFSSQNNGIRVQVRVKTSNGAGGLLDSLNAASAAAPMALPSVVALPRADLEVAALKGLIYPLDGQSVLIDQPDWYDYARQLAMVQGATFGLPFAGDAYILAYRPGFVTDTPVDWPAIFRLAQPLAFPAGDPQSLFLLSLYQSVGGPVEDAQRRPTLDPEVLSQVLQMLADGEQLGVFPDWLSQYETNGQVWQAYRENRVNMLVTWVSNYLANLPPDTTAIAVPSMDDSPMTLATSWAWAVSDPDPARRAVSVRLVEFLSDGEFLARWTEAAGYLPTRPSALAAWSNQSFKTLLSPVAVTAQARPSGDQLSSLGPVLRDASLKVLKRESDPTQAARAAAEKLTAPETR
jgi:multiple sugar transport system substrate-binding protein